MHVDSFSGAKRDALKRILIANAKTGLEILEHSRRLYSGRYHLPLMAFCAVYLGDALIRYSPSDPLAPKVVAFCLEVLHDNRPGFAICGPLQELFRRSAVTCRVALPSTLRELMKPNQHCGVDDILDACTRISYRQPIEQIVQHIDPSIAEDWDEEWRRIFGPLESNRPLQGRADNERFMHINSLLND